jgi:endonuclease/exonuclease/phosphatase family metal-dependent hydrolase
MMHEQRRKWVGKLKGLIKSGGRYAPHPFDQALPDGDPLSGPARAAGMLRVMTYNVHSCIGTDRKLSPARIAHVIAECNPDVACLQELDVRRRRTGGVDQAHRIAEHLKMEFHFHPALTVAEERYGDAILSRVPLQLVKAGPIPGLSKRPELEPRGALWVRLQLDGHGIQLVNTHLGLVAEERRRQVEALLGSEWLDPAVCQGPTIFCGDLNALPRSRVYRLLRQRLFDAQLSCNGHRPKKTFFSGFPIGRIDHVFVSQQLEIAAVQVPLAPWIRKASDHLPLVVDIRLPGGNGLT